MNKETLLNEIKVMDNILIEKGFLKYSMLSFWNLKKNQSKKHLTEVFNWYREKVDISNGIYK